MYDMRLVTAAQQGDELAFAALFDRNVDAVHDLCWALTGDRDEAARIVADVFTLVARHLGELTDASQLRPWLLAIARDRVLSEDQAGTLHTAWGTRPEQPVAGGVPLGGSDLRWWTREAASVLALADQVVIELAFRYDLDADQLAAAIGVAPDDLPQVLDQVEQEADLVLGALVLARQGQRDCPELADLLEGWDGVPTVEVAESVDLHARTCGRCVRRLSVAHPLELLGSAPPVPPSPELRAIVLEQAGAELPHATPTESGSRRARGAGVVVDPAAAFAAENMTPDAPAALAGSSPAPEDGPATAAMPVVGAAGAAAGGAVLGGAVLGDAVLGGAGGGTGTGGAGTPGGAVPLGGRGGVAGVAATGAAAAAGAAGGAAAGGGVGGGAGPGATVSLGGTGGGGLSGSGSVGAGGLGGPGRGGGILAGGGPGGRSSLERLRERPWVALAAVGTAIVILIVAVVLLLNRGSSPTRLVAAATTTPPTTLPPTTVKTTLASSATLIPVATSTTTSTTAPRPTTTSTTAAPVAPLALNATSVTLGASATTAQVVLTDTGQSTSAWTASSSVPWLTVSPASGSLAAGASVTVTLTLDRAAAPTGAFNVQVHFTPAGAPAASITVVGSNSPTTTTSSTTSTTAPGSTTTQPGATTTTRPGATTTRPPTTTTQPSSTTIVPKATTTVAK